MDGMRDIVANQFMQRNPVYDLGLPQATAPATLTLPQVDKIRKRDEPTKSSKKQKKAEKKATVSAASSSHNNSSADESTVLSEEY